MISRRETVDRLSFGRSLGPLDGCRVFPETVLEPSGNVLQILHAPSSSSLSSLGFHPPFVRSHFSGRVATAGAGFVLFMERTRVASPAQRV